MRTNDDIWLREQDPWGVDRLAWEDDEDDAQPDREEENAPEDPRY